MKKVIIISYFAPPCSLTPSNRISGWMENLIQFGYYPIVFSRHWDKDISRLEDTSIKNDNAVKIEKTEAYEIHYLPYNPPFNEVLFLKLRGSRFQFISKFATLFQLFRESFFLHALPYKNLYHQANKYLEENVGIEKVIISGNPFGQFRFGYELQKRHENLRWIADYRDDWTTSALIRPKGIQLIIHKLNQKNEKKWITSAARITSVSPNYVQKISNFTGVKGETILNGYRELIPLETASSVNQFKIVFNGSLYPTQDVENFLEGLKSSIDQFKNRISVHIDFPGVAFNPTQLKRIEKSMRGYEENYSTSNRIPKEEVIRIQQNCDLLLMLSHSGIKGIPSSKLYEYLCIQKPIILFPNDHDIIEETLLDTNTGYICDNKSELIVTLHELIENKINGENSYLGIEEKVKQYSSFTQSKKLANLLDEL